LRADRAGRTSSRRRVFRARSHRRAPENPVSPSGASGSERSVRSERPHGL
jgi:hypothetical protein